MSAGTLPTVQSSGKEADAVILFADIVGCSQISDALGLREYAQFIREFHEKATLAAELVFNAHHYVRNTDYELSIRGDETCLILHRSPIEDIQRALTFAVTLQLLWLSGAYNRQRLAKAASPVELGIGIHTGSVYIDTFQHQHPTSEGYSINVAKRIEGHTRDGTVSKIMLSSQSFAHLPPEHRALSFIAVALPQPIEVRGVQGAFVLRELVDIDETFVLDLKVASDTFDEKLLDQIKFVAETRVDAQWLSVLWRIAFGVAHGEEKLFRKVFSLQTGGSHNTASSWFLRAKREREAGDPNMASMLFELSAAAADGLHSIHDPHGAKAWAFYNAALADEDRNVFAASIRAYQRALRVTPSNPHYQLGLVAGYVKAKRAEEGLAFLREIRDEFIEDSRRAASLYLESVCLDQLGERANAASCRELLERKYDVERTALPPAESLLKAGADSGDILVKAFQTARSTSRG